MKPSARAPIARLTRFGHSLRRAPLLVAFIAGSTGIVLADNGSVASAGLLCIALIGLAVILRTRSKPLASIAIGSAVAFAALSWRHLDRLEEISSFPLASELANGERIEIGGSGWIVDANVPGDRSLSATLELESLTIGDHRVSSRHRLPCFINQPTNDLGYGSRIHFTGLLYPLEEPRSPGGFDARAFYFRDSGSLARLEIREGDRFSVVPGKAGSSLVRFAVTLRSRLEEALLAGIPPSDEPYARLIAGMTLGARENSPEELEEHFRTSGTLHLFAVSGMHVGVVAGLVMGLLYLLRVPRAASVVVTIPIVLFYAVLTGLSPSAVRAAIMLAAFLAAYSFRERAQLINSLGFAGLILLLIDTQQLFLPGFQLSFLVVLFIALFTSAIRNFLVKPFLTDPFIPRSLVPFSRRSIDRFTQVIAASLAVSVASWLGSLGLLVWHFQSVSLIGIVANVLMVPLAGVIITLASASLAAFGLRLFLVSILTNKVNVGTAIALTGMARFFAEIPGANLNTGQPGETTSLSSNSSAVLRLELMGERGEGAALLSVPGDRNETLMLWMIDSGGPHTYQSQVLPLLRVRGINHLDALVMTHGDHGHIGSTPALISHFRPAVLMESVAENRSPTLGAIRHAAERAGIQTLALERGHRLTIGNGAVCTILWPNANRPGRLADDRSLVLKLQYEEWRILLTSDSGFDTERELLDSGTDLRAELWIRGQHLESPSALPSFVEAINPRAVISSHADFPKSENIPASLRDQLNNMGIPMFTLDSGSVSVEADEERLRITPFSKSHESLAIGR